MSSLWTRHMSGPYFCSSSRLTRLWGGRHVTVAGRESGAPRAPTHRADWCSNCANALSTASRHAATSCARSGGGGSSL